MNQFKLLIFLFLFIFYSCGAQTNFNSGISKPPSHEPFTILLKKYLDSNGGVNYEGFIQDSLILNAYLKTLQNTPPDEKLWSRNEQMAYWINVYNAFTIKLIIDHYPVKSIKDIAGNIPFINSPWDVKFIHIGNQTLDLNNVEHGILRKHFDEPLIHVAVNCASVSCPNMRNEAYTADSLIVQLHDQAKAFINDPKKNVINQQSAQLSKILKWYKGDFKNRYGGVEGFVNAYYQEELSKDLSFSYLDYNWKLNSSANMR